MTGRRVRLLLPRPAEPWSQGLVAAGLRGVMAELTAASFDTGILDAAEPQPPDALSIVTGAGPAAIAAPLREAYRLGRRLAAEPGADAPTLLLAPLTGGIAAGALMARATGEAFTNWTVALHADAPTADRLRAYASRLVDPGPFVSEALEAQCRRLADRLIGPSTRLPLPVPRRREPLAHLAPEAITDLVFVGPATAGNGLPAFLSALERLDAAGLMAGRRALFVGPMRDAARGWSKDLLGIRASHWRFDFRVLDTTDAIAAIGELVRPGRLPVFSGFDHANDLLAAALLAAGHPVLAVAGADLHAVLARVMANGLDLPGPMPAPGWAALASAWLADHRPIGVAKTPPRLAVAITHRDRPAALSRALASIAAAPPPAGTTTLVIDHASESPAALALLTGLDAAPPVHGMVLLRRGTPEPQAEALNRVARESDADVLVFLDDDNLIAPGGLSRIATAFATGDADIVVTNLALFDADDPAPTPRPDAVWVFLGDAGNAGLFFNGFGDTAMAVRREAFLAIGGFETTDHGGPALDWVFLAKARARGLRIAVIQEPAIAYARDLAAADFKWRKRDQEGARAAVRAAYAGAYDADLVAALAQNLTEGLF